MILSINVVCERVMVCADQLWEKVIPRANLAGLSSDISYQDLRSDAKRSFSAAEEAAEKMSSM
jgi:hypothetical protein